MIIQDRGEYLPQYVINLGEKYPSIPAMRTAGEDLLSAGKAEAILGLSSMALGTLVYARGKLTHDDHLSRIGRIVGLEGVGGTLTSIVTMGRASNLKVSANQLSATVQRGGVKIKPDGHGSTLFGRARF